MLTSEQIDELKSIDIEFVAEELGIPVKLHHSNCPFHLDDQHSLVFRPLKGTWECPVCGARGNQISLVSKRYSLGEYDAEHFLANLMGIIPEEKYYNAIIENRIRIVALDKVKEKMNEERAEKLRIEKERRRIAEEIRRREEEKRRLEEEERKRKEEEEKRKLQEEARKKEELAMRKRNLSYEAYSINNIDTEILDFIVGRAQLCASSIDLLYKQLYISKDIVKKFKIGSISRPNSLYLKLVEAFGSIRTKNSGLFTFDGGLKANFPCPALIIPFYDMNGHIGNLQFIKIDNFNKERSFADKTQNLPFNLKILSDPNIKDVVLAKDILDCLMLNSDGYNAFTLPSNFVVNNVIELLKKKNLSFEQATLDFTADMDTYWKLKAEGITPRMLMYSMTLHIKNSRN